MPSPGSSTLKSLTIKALERRADGVVILDATDPPLAVVEFQFQNEPTVFFGYNELDPKTEPWTPVVRSYSFPDVHLGKVEIEMILLGELPELEETQSGKDLIRIGEARGEARGLVKAVLLHLSVRHGEVPDEVERQIRALSAEQAERLLEFVLQCETLADVAQWLGEA